MPDWVVDQVARQDAAAGDRGGREAVPALPEVDVLGVGLDADHDTRAWGELVVVADLATAGEAVVGAAVAEGEDASAVASGHAADGGAGEDRVAGRNADDGRAAALAGIEAVAGVDTEVGAGPGEHRNGREHRRRCATRQVSSRRGGGQGREGRERRKDLVHI